MSVRSLTYDWEMLARWLTHCAGGVVPAVERGVHRRPVGRGERKARREEGAENQRGLSHVHGNVRCP